jgi:AbiV family abortive infection protein
MDAFKFIHENELGFSEEKYIRGVEEFNLACDHIVSLIEDSYLLFKHQSFSTSLFLSITSIEETAKTNIGTFFSGNISQKNAKRNIFLNHKTKHLLATLPTVLMGDRLKKVVDQDILNDFFNKLKNGHAVELREESLYCDRKGGEYRSPRKLIMEHDAKNFLLLAIEIFDDALVGMSNHTFQLREKTDQIFQKLADGGL